LKNDLISRKLIREDIYLLFLSPYTLRLFVRAYKKIKSDFFLFRESVIV